MDDFQKAIEEIKKELGDEIIKRFFEEDKIDFQQWLVNYQYFSAMSPINKPFMTPDWFLAAYPYITERMDNATKEEEAAFAKEMGITDEQIKNPFSMNDPDTGKVKIEYLYKIKEAYKKIYGQQQFVFPKRLAPLIIGIIQIVIAIIIVTIFGINVFTGMVGGLLLYLGYKSFKVAMFGSEQLINEMTDEGRVSKSSNDEYGKL